MSQSLLALLAFAVAAQAARPEVCANAWRGKGDWDAVRCPGNAQPCTTTFTSTYTRRNNVVVETEDVTVATRTERSIVDVEYRTVTQEITETIPTYTVYQTREQGNNWGKRQEEAWGPWDHDEDVPAPTTTAVHTPDYTHRVPTTSCTTTLIVAPRTTTSCTTTKKTTSSSSSSSSSTSSSSSSSSSSTTKSTTTASTTCSTGPNGRPTNYGPGDHDGYPGDHDGYPGDHDGYPGDHNGFPGDHNGYPGDGPRVPDANTRPFGTSTTRPYGNQYPTTRPNNGEYTRPNGPDYTRPSQPEVTTRAGPYEPEYTRNVCDCLGNCATSYTTTTEINQITATRPVYDTTTIEITATSTVTETTRVTREVEVTKWAEVGDYHEEPQHNEWEGWSS